MPSPDRGYYRFMAAVVCIIALEVVYYKGVQALKDLLAGSPVLVGLYQIPGTPVGGAALLVHNLINATVLAGIVWLLLFGRGLYRARTRFVAPAGGAAFSKRYILLHVLALTVLVFIRAALNGYRIPLFDVDPAWLVIAYGVCFMLFATSALRIFAPFGFWRDDLRGQGWRIAAVGAVCVVVASLATLGIGPARFEQAYHQALFSATVAGTTGILEWWGYQVRVDLVTAGLTADDFSVTIASSCLGYEGVTIAFVTLIGYLAVNRARIRFPEALLVFPVVAAALFVANCLRLATLMAIGASWSADIAIYGFHTVAGWINLVLVLAVAIVALERLSFFARTPSTLAFDLSAGKIRLLPQVVLIAVTLVSLLVSPGFEWLYPLRVVVVGALLLIIWPRLELESMSRIGLPVGVGIAVFMLWVALVPDDPSNSQRFGTALFSASSWVVGAWLAVRMLGAVVIVPLAEELAFRGYLFTMVETALGASGRFKTPNRSRLLALLITSVGFGLLHSAWLAGTLAGLAYGALKLQRGRLIDAVIAHSVTNLLLAGYVFAVRAWSLW